MTGSWRFGRRWFVQWGITINSGQAELVKGKQIETADVVQDVETPEKKKDKAVKSKRQKK